MKRFLAISVALSSMLLAYGMSNIPANAQTVTSTPTTSTQSAPTVESVEQAIFNQINQYRASRGMSPLTINTKISEQARTHSQNMANGKVAFGHDGFTQRVQAIATAIPYSAAAENVAYNGGYSDPATQAVQGWLKSSGHLQNIEGNYNLTGIGVAKNAKGQYYFTQIFLRSR